MSDIERFENFTEGARNVLGRAAVEAQSFQHPYLGTEHLLLGLMSEEEGIAVKVLANFGVDREKVRSQVEFMMGRGDHMALGSISLTPRAKTVIEEAQNQARRQNQHSIGTEHLLVSLVSLVREENSIAAGVLESLEVNLVQVYELTLQMLKQRGEWEL